MSTNAHTEKKRLENPPKSIKFTIQRREKEGANAHWETFELPYRRNLNVISVLMDIRKNPVTVEGKQTTPPVWDMSCLEQVCGICTMIIDGRVRQSCSALIDDLLLESGGDTVILAPMSKFPNIRDLKVDPTTYTLQSSDTFLIDVAQSLATAEDRAIKDLAKNIVALLQTPW